MAEAAPTSDERRRSRIAFPALLALAALDAAGYSVIAPVVPAVARSTGAGPALIGALSASFSAAMVVGFSLSGRRLAGGRSRGVLGSGLALVALGSLGFAFARGLPAYFARGARLSAVLNRKFKSPLDGHGLIIPDPLYRDFAYEPRPANVVRHFA